MEQNDMFFSQRFGVIKFLRETKRYCYWKFYGIDHTEKPFMIYGKKTIFCCDTKALKLRKFPKNYNLKAIEILYDGNEHE